MENQSNSTPLGELVVRTEYLDGRVTAVIKQGTEWQVDVFPSKAIAKMFAEHYNLEYRDVSDSPPV
jgi:hypothetical protein